MAKHAPPPGSRKSGGAQVTSRLRVALDRAIDELERRERPIHMIIADGLEKDPAKMITAIRGLLPQEVSHTVLDVTQLHLQAVKELSRMHSLPSPTEEPMVIDVEPVAVVTDQTEDDD